MLSNKLLFSGFIISALTIMIMSAVPFSYAIDCSTPESALRSYYGAYYSENLDDYYSVVDTSDLSETSLSYRKSITQKSWEKFDVINYSVDINESEVERNNALVGYHLSFEITDGSESFNSSDYYYAYLIHDSESGCWKVSEIFQKDELQSFVADTFLLTQNDLIDDINEANEKVPFNSESEISETSNKEGGEEKQEESRQPESTTQPSASGDYFPEVLCLSDEECIEKGYSECVNGHCVNYSSENALCPSSILIVVLLTLGISKYSI